MATRKIRYINLTSFRSQKHSSTGAPHRPGSGIERVGRGAWPVRENGGMTVVQQVEKNAAPDPEWLLATRDYIIHRTQLSVLYHRKRERFYALLDRRSKAGAVVAGTAAFSSLVTTAKGKSTAGLQVAIATLPRLVFAWNDKARIHAEFAQKFALIEAEVIADGWDHLTSAKFDAWHSKIKVIEATEPLILYNLIVLCKNQLAVTKCEPDVIVQLPWWQRWTAHLFDIAPKS